MSVNLAGEAKIGAAAIEALEAEFANAYRSLRGMIKGKGVKMFQITHTTPKQLLRLEQEAFDGRMTGILAKAAEHRIIPSATAMHTEFHSAIDALRSAHTGYHAAASELSSVAAAEAPLAADMYAGIGNFAEKLKLQSGAALPIQQAEQEFVKAYDELKGFMGTGSKSMYLVNLQNPRQLLRAGTAETFEGHMLGMVRKAEERGVIQAGGESHKAFNNYLDRMREARGKYLVEAERISAQQMAAGPTL